MRSHKTFKGIAVLLSAVITFSAFTGMETSDATENETLTEITAEEASDSTAADEEKDEMSGHSGDELADWKKAEVSEYDSSISLVSYAPTTPEILAAAEKAAKRKAEAAEKANQAISDQERTALAAKRAAIKQASPLLTKKRKSADPTAVELYLSGGNLSDLPDPIVPVVSRNPGEFSVVSYGWGHGVGMSQNGANFYALYSGWTYQDILFHYFPGTYLMDTGLVGTENLTIAHAPAGNTLEVVSKIVYNEVGSSFAYEAIKAQAVAVYTYIKYNGDDSSDLRGKPNPPQIVIDACAEVLGQALYYDGDYALTMFSASCGGCSANCYEVFYQDIPYLRSVDSYYDSAYDPHYGTVSYYSTAAMRRKLQNAYGITLSDDPANWIQPIYSEETGYATDVCIDGQMWVRAYPFSLAMGFKSCKFDIGYTYGDSVTDYEIIGDPVMRLDPVADPMPNGRQHYEYDPTEDPTEEITSEEPVTDEPATDEPATEEPATEDTSAADPSTEPGTDEPTTGDVTEPTSEEPGSITTEPDTNVDPSGSSVNTENNT